MLGWKSFEQLAGLLLAQIARFGGKLASIAPVGSTAVAHQNELGKCRAGLRLVLDARLAKQFDRRHCVPFTAVATQGHARQITASGRQSSVARATKQAASADRIERNPLAEAI